MEKQKFVSVGNKEMAERCFHDLRLHTIDMLVQEEVNCAGLEKELEKMSARTDLKKKDKEDALQVCKDNIETKANKIGALRGKLDIVVKLEKDIDKFLK